MLQQAAPAGHRAGLAKMRSGALVFSIAGAAWGIYGGYSLRHTAGWWPLGAVVLIATAVFAAWSSLRARLARLAPVAPDAAARERDERAARWFNIVNAVQGFAILVAVQVCANLHASEFFPVAFSVIVGLHFVALAPVFHSRFHAVFGVCMCLWAALVVLTAPKFLDAAGPDGQRTFVWACLLGLGNAFLLWGAAAWRLHPAPPAPRPCRGDRPAPGPHPCAAAPT